VRHRRAVLEPLDQRRRRVAFQTTLEREPAATKRRLTIVPWHGAAPPRRRQGPPVWMHFDIGAGVRYYAVFDCCELTHMFC